MFSHYSNSRIKKLGPIILIGLLVMQISLPIFSGAVFAQESPSAPSAPSAPAPTPPPAPEPEPEGEAGAQSEPAPPAPPAPEAPSEESAPPAPEAPSEPQQGGGPGAPSAPYAPGEEPPEEEPVAEEASAESTAENGNETGTSTNVDGNSIDGVGEFNGEYDGSSTEIITGDALAVYNSIQVANFNAFESNGVFLLLNNLFGVQGDLDLRDLDSLFANVDYGVNDRKCSILGCSDGGDFEMNTKNNAGITNDVVIRSGSGANEIANTAGDVSVESGDATAIGNLVNVANANFQYANYGVVVYNAINWNGDVILPSFVEEGYQSTGRTVPLGEETDIVNVNKANITDNTGSTADSGTNKIQNTGGTATIESGNANAATSIVTQANQTFINKNSVIVVFRIFGGFTGEVLNTPKGVLWEETADGLSIYSSEDTSGGEVAIPLDEEGSEGGTTFDDVEIRNFNDATITNNVYAFALTGANNLANNAGDARIKSGDAFSAVSIANIANLNVLGGNFLMAIINVFNPNGWGGNVSFGRPDLWVAGRAELKTPNPVPGSEVTYKYTVTNKGDAPATDVKLKSFFDKGLIEFNRPTGKLASLGIGKQAVPSNEQVWSLGTIMPGESVDTVFTGIVSSVLPNGQTVINNRTSVSGKEADGNMDDNSDTVTLSVYSGSSFGGASTAPRRVSPNPARTAPPEFQLRKTANLKQVDPGDSIDFEIVLRNSGTWSGYNSVLVDKLIGPDGAIVNEQKWDLGEVFRGEEILVSYTIEFDENAVPGVYTNDAYVEALAGHKDPKYGYPVVSESAASQFTVTGDPIVVEPKKKEVTKEEEKKGKAPVVAAPTKKSSGPSKPVATSKKQKVAPANPGDGQAEVALVSSVVPIGMMSAIMFLLATSLVLVLWWRSELALKVATSNGGNGGNGAGRAKTYSNPFVDTMDLNEFGEEFLIVLSDIGRFIMKHLRRTAPFFEATRKYIINVAMFVKEFWVYGITTIGFYLIKVLTGHEVERNLKTRRPKLVIKLPAGDGGSGRVAKVRLETDKAVEFASRVFETIIATSKTIFRALSKAPRAIKKNVKAVLVAAKKYWILGITKSAYYAIKGLTGHEIEIKKKKEDK